jgi:cytochrome c biogenesis protein
MIYVLYQHNQQVARGIVAPGQTTEIPLGQLTFDRYSLFTGLQVKDNPALPYSFTGFILATVGVLMHLFWNPRRRIENVPRGSETAAEN